MSAMTDSERSAAGAAALDAEEAARARAVRREKVGRYVVPVMILAGAILLWDRVVVWNEIPHYILPRPGRVLLTLIADWGVLWESLLNTLQVTFYALAIATVGGAGLAILFVQSKWIEMSMFPFAVILQVTPIIAVAPLIFIYFGSDMTGQLICAWIVAFFPILSNTTLGLNSADHNLHDLFRLYGASRWQVLRYLRIPASMPYFLGGLRIAGGLALIGAIVAEFTAGAAGSGSGLAFRILESGYRLNVSRMFAAVLLIAATGVSIFMTISLISYLVLHRWHESAARRES